MATTSKPKRFAIVSAAFVLTATAPAPGWAQNAGVRYTAAYQAAGFRLRAAYVCPGDKKAMFQHALVSVSTSEFKIFSEAFPKTIQKWMTQGADVFNDLVMLDGIAKACERAW